MMCHWILLLCLCSSSVAAPPGKRPRTESCLVQTDLFKGTVTECDGALEKLSDLASVVAPQGADFGAVNLAELLLARSGVFDTQLNLQNLRICSKHRSSLGPDWMEKEENRPKFRKGTQNILRCNMPAFLQGYPYAQHNYVPAVRLSVMVDQAKAIWEQLLVFVPPGTAMCRNHAKYVAQLKGRNDALDEQGDAAAAEPEAHGSPETSPGQGASYYESPVPYRGWEAVRRDQICSQTPPVSQGSNVETPSGSDQGSQELIVRNRQRAREQTCANIKQSIRDIAAAIGLKQELVNFPQSYMELSESTKAKRANTALHVTDAVVSAFSPDAPNVLMERIIEKRSGNWLARKKSEKFIAFVENVVEEYAMAPTRQTRLQTLAAISPLLRYAELEKHLPGLTRYAYKESRRYARMLKAGVRDPERSTHRERYNRAKVELFIAFITSPNIVSDMPFGHVNVRRESGMKQEIPNLVRTSINQRIIAQYQSYLRDTGKSDMALSESTMWRILHACKATTRKSLLGLDYYTYEGIQGIANLIELVEKIRSIDLDADWALETTRTLRSLKAFFKGDYKVYIQKESEFSDYSRAYALSDPSNGLLRAVNPGEPENMRRCAMCITMMNTFKEIGSKVSTLAWQEPVATNQKEAEFILEKSKEAIMEWQKHIVRTINQHAGKEEILLNLDSDSVWILMDWAMKFIPRKGIESQTEWYGKRGLSWHISVAFARDPETNQFFIRTYVHIFEPVAQDADTVLAIIQDVIGRIKSERPELRKVYLRSDNAVCYHSGPTLASILLTSEKTGVQIVRYDFSDPQSGKGACDRATSVIKRHVHQYVSENNKCTTPAEFLECAGSYNGVNSVTFIHAALEAPESRSGKGSIVGVSPFHNFDFSNRKIQAWQAYKIGDGKELRFTPRVLPLPRLHPVYTVSTGGKKHNSLLQDKANWIPLTAKTIPAAEREPAQPLSQSEEGWVPDDSDNGHITEAASAHHDAGNDGPDNPRIWEGPHRKGLYLCEEEGCSKVYQSYFNWYRHVTIGKHTKRAERQSLRDVSIDKYVENIETSQALSGLPLVLDAIRSQRDQELALDSSVEALPMGWALKVRRPVKRFTQLQKQYLTEKFNEGAKTGIKYNPQDVAAMMRRDPLFPSKDDWLTWTQIASFWSRLSHNRERSSAADQATDSRVPVESEIDLEEIADDPYANAFVEHVEESIQSVIDQVMGRQENPSTST